MAERLFDRPELLVPREEFLRRQDSARAKAAEASLDGLVVYSRGGSAVDMHPEVFYLTNHYSPHPYFGDHQELGTARSHAVTVLPVNGPAILIVDGPWWRPDLVVADDVRAASDINSEVGKALRDSGLVDNRVGLVGTSFMSAAAGCSGTSPARPPLSWRTCSSRNFGGSRVPPNWRSSVGERISAAAPWTR